MQADNSSDAVGVRRAVRDWRSREIADVQRSLSEKARILRLELDSDLSRLPWWAALRWDRRVFARHVEAKLKPAFDDLAESLLTKGGRGLRASVTDVTVAGGQHPARGGHALIEWFRTVLAFVVPVAFIGISAYFVFFVAITKVSGWFLTQTDVHVWRLLLGLAIFATSTFLLLSAPVGLRKRKHRKVLEQYDAWIETEISPADLEAVPTSLESRLVSAIRRRADALEADLSGV